MTSKPPTGPNDTRGLSKAFLRELGLALYGPSWESEMARNLGVAARLVRRWHFGTTPIPDDVWLQLREQLRLRRLVLDELLLRFPE